MSAPMTVRVIPLTDGAGTHTVLIRFGGQDGRYQQSGTDQAARSRRDHRRCRRRSKRYRDYSQAGAQAGFGLLWTVVLTWPLMVAVQSVSARIGRVHRPRSRRQHVPRLSAAGGAGCRPAPVRRQHDQYRCRPRRHGRSAGDGGRVGQVAFTFLFALVSVLAIIFIPVQPLLSAS